MPVDEKAPAGCQGVGVLLVAGRRGSGTLFIPLAVGGVKRGLGYPSSTGGMALAQALKVTIGMTRLRASHFCPW